jgi:AcrR family transcriptional regulator
VATNARISSAEARQRILDATRDLLDRRGDSVLNVAAIAGRAGIHRTVFYRHFDDTNQAIAALIDELASRQAVGAGAWFTDDGPTGTRDVIYANALGAAQAFAPNAQLVCAIADAAAHDDELRTMWHECFVQPRIDATAAAIRRDQATGSVRVDLDPDDTALALQTMGITLGLQILGREHGEPERLADIITPIWEAVLFGSS